MKLWLKLHIGGQAWKVYITPSCNKKLNFDGDHCAGRCDYDACKIYISKALDDQAREDTLLHELLHALLYVSGAENAYDGDPKIDETIVSALTPILHRLLKDLGFRFPQLYVA